MLYGDYVSISATASGVSGTINVPKGVRLVGIDLNWMDADGIPTRVVLSGGTLPQSLEFVPNVGGQLQTGNSAATGICQSPLINLRPFNLTWNGGNITVTVTSTAPAIVVVGLTWEA